MASRTGNPHGKGSTPLTNPILVGTTIVVALIVGVFLSYNANKGLPFVKTFPLKVRVPDAQELVVGSEVRIGGFRVGQVNAITAEPARGKVPPYAELTLALDGTLKGVPSDTRFQVRPRSLLGAKYVELDPGDGPNVKANATLPLKQALTTPELDESFDVFDAKTRKGLQGTIRSFGDALAGRGDDINRSIVATHRLLPPLQRVLETLSSRKTDLSGFIDGAARLTRALGPISQTFVDLFDNGAKTLAAIDAAGPALGQTIDEIDLTERAADQALGNVNPVLRDLADITIQLRDGAGRLPQTTNALAGALESGTHVLRRIPELAPKANATLRTLGTVSRDPAATGSLRKLTGTVNQLRPTLNYLTTAQVHCNVFGLFQRNFYSPVSQGDDSGTWLTFYDIFKAEQTSKVPKPEPELHINYYPHENASECESGNEPYKPRAVHRQPGRQAVDHDREHAAARRRHRPRPRRRPARHDPGSVAVRRRAPNFLRLAIIGVVVVSIGVYIVFTKRIPFVHGYRFSADFASSNQLIPGFSPVRIAGVSVGKVVKLSPGPHNTTKVMMELKDSGLPLHRDARARIRPRLFLEGGFSVELNPGSPDAPNLPEGATLPQAQTAGPVQLHQILSAFDHSTRDDLRSFLADLDVALDHGGAKAFGQSFKPLNPVLRDTAQIAEAARGVREHDTSHVVESSAKIAGALADHETALRGLVHNLNTVTTATASRDAQLAAGIRQIDLLVTVAPEKIDRINATLPAINRFVSALRPSLRALPPVLDHTVPVLEQTRALVSASELPALVDALAPTVLRLHPLELALDRLFPLITPVSNCIRKKAVPALEDKAPDGALSTDRPIYQDLVHAFVGLSSAAQSFDGNGYEIRYLATAGETSIGTGQVPGLGTLTGSAAQPITGSRPTYLGPGVDYTPFIRPDVPCAKDAVIDLTQRAGGGGAVPTARHITLPHRPRLSPAELRRTVRQFNRGIRTISSTVPSR